MEPDPTRKCRRRGVTTVALLRGKPSHAPHHCTMLLHENKGRMTLRLLTRIRNGCAAFWQLHTPTIAVKSRKKLVQ